MGNLTFGQRSQKNLEGVHPDLIKVMNRAIEMAEPEDDFFINEGVRTVERQRKLYAQGRTAPGPKVTWTLNSNHFVNAKTKKGHAVDAYPFPYKDIDTKAYKARQKRLITLVLRAADELDIPVRSGADWDMDGNFGERGEGDSPHYELWGYGR